MRLSLAKHRARFAVESHDSLAADVVQRALQIRLRLHDVDRAAVAQNRELHQFRVRDRAAGVRETMRCCHFINRSSVSPISAGDLATEMPADSSAAILSLALPLP